MKPIAILSYAIFLAIFVVFMLQTYYNYLFHKKQSSPTKENKMLEKINLAFFSIMTLIFVTQTGIIAHGSGKIIYGIPHPIVSF